MMAPLRGAQQRAGIRVWLVAVFVLALLPLWPGRAAAQMEPAAQVAPATVGGPTGPVIALSQRVTQEPLLGGQVVFATRAANNGVQPVADRAYNLTISNTLPAGLTYQSATPAPTAVTAQADGSTQLLWDNVVDLEAGESFEVSVAATLPATLTVGTPLPIQALGRANAAPDNSGAWLQATGSLAAAPQAVDIELAANQSTGNEQATGAGEMPGALGHGAGADWPYQYAVSVRSNNVGPVSNAEARVVLPAGVAYGGGVLFSANPNNVSTTPQLSLAADGKLTLRWPLGTLTTAQYANPIVITFAAAIPYRLRTGADTAALNGPFAGPMSGDIIAEDTGLPVRYEATGTYAGAPTSDGSDSTPSDDPPATVTAELLTVRKSATPGTVGIGTTVAYALNVYVSEYYTVTNGVLVDVLPDGTTYVADSASLAPRTVAEDTPAPGQTTITWDLATASTVPGAAPVVTFQAMVDPTYSAPALAGQPVVSGDALTNQVTATGEWQDVVDPTRLGTLTPDTAQVTVRTRMPGFDKKVLDVATGQWVANVPAFVGDTLTFRLTYAAAADVDAKGIVIRDYLPRGMSYVAGSAVHAVNGAYTDGPGCTAAPQAPTTGTLSGLTYLEWRLCNTGRGATWQADIQARVGPVPNVQPGWIVANFGKLSGQNSLGANYSLRAMALTNYKAPRLVLDKSVAPDRNLKAGDVITYTITVTNRGDATAYNLAVRDTLPVSLTVANTGGSASPSAATYTTISGDPAASAGGVLLWSNVTSLAPGQVQTYRYTAVIPPGLAAGAQLVNMATVRYNSRGDNQGHQVEFSGTLADDQTDDAIAYIKGLTLTKRALAQYATIGDTVRWVITGTVPAGVRGYWPVVEENDLPPGFDYVLGSTVVTTATLDTANHVANPKDDGDRDLRWFLQSIDNSGGATNYLFTIQFDTLVTGVKGNATGTKYYPNNWTIENAPNTAVVGWYDKATGYNNTGYSWDGFETNKIDRRSPGATYTVLIRQPNLALQKIAGNALVGAGDAVTFTVVLKNIGNDIAYDMVLTDVLPVGTTLLGVEPVQVTYAAGFPVPNEPDAIHVAATSVPGTAFAYIIDRLYVGASVTVVYRVQVASDISADLALTNVAGVAQYSSKLGTAPDTNNDGLSDERTYAGPTATAVVRTPQATIQKTVAADELTYGSTLDYTLTVPAEPINAVLYNVVVTDVIDAALSVTGVSNGSANGNQVQASFASIAPNQQQVIVVHAALPANSPAPIGTLVRNTAWVRYDNGGIKPSNEVANTIVAPALTLDKEANRLDVQPGELVQYALHVRNVGNGRALKVQLADVLPEGFVVEAGTTLLDDKPYADPAGTVWDLPDLSGGAEHWLTYQARALKAEPGVPYVNTAKVIAADSRGVAVPADNSARVPADGDPDDTATALVYGPLTWKTESTFVAFEDLKNVGWCDWDYNDFIVRLDVETGLTPDGSLAALRLRYEPLAHGGAYNHRFIHQLPVYGGGLYRLHVYNQKQQLVSQGGGTIGDEPAITIFEATKTAMPLPVNQPYDLIKWPFSNTMQEQNGTVAGWTATLEVLLAQPAANPTEALPPLPWDPYLYVYNTKQEVHLLQPGRLDNSQVVNNAYDPGNPMLGFDLPLANVFRAGWHWPQEFLGIWRVYPEYVNYATTDGAKAQGWWDPAQADVRLDYAWHATSTQLAAAGVQWAESVSSRYYASPLIADLDGDGKAEIAVGNLVQWQLEVYNSNGTRRAGWPQMLHAEVKAAANAADLDGDGKLEVVVGDTRGYLYAFRPNGEALPGWPIQTSADTNQPFRILSRPALADLNGDGRPEVVLALSDGKLYVYNSAGQLLPGWPQTLGEAADRFGSHIIDSSPVVADLDGDGRPEIVVGSYDKHLYAYHADGSLAWRFVTRDVILATPAVGDLDKSRPGLETVIASGDRFVYVVDASGALVWKRPTGWTIRSSPLVADVDGDGNLEIVVGSDDHKVWAWRADGSMLPGWPKLTGAAVASSPVFADVDGDGLGEIVVGSDDTLVYAWKADGSAVAGWPVALETPLKSAPAVGNLDGDAAAELVGGSFGGALRYFGVIPVAGGNNALYLPVISRR